MSKEGERKEDILNGLHEAMPTGSWLWSGRSASPTSS